MSGKSLHTNQRNRLLILVTLPAVADLFRPLLLPAKAEEPEFECSGLTTFGMRFCASQNWEESNQALKEQLNPATLKKWKAATREVCAAAGEKRGADKKKEDVRLMGREGRRKVYRVLCNSVQKRINWLIPVSAYCNSISN